ncbi:hypothetical protein DC31_06475 [Microbacterium sp. CH12i]|uniref:hypothetical protein n=1 Tax=Microbacterium sp. CH12i TaxID=1479651 RepID=UPI000460A886|nr:hypothetical protein [Microbacterium sp. CH12i]KDA04526.1 hypothetical protein DC31_06475 [Microbacterium sp. CH12i]
MTTQYQSPAYCEAVTAIVNAEVEFWEASIREVTRLIPAGVCALLFRINDTPRLTFDAYLDEDGVEHEAEEVGGDDGGLFDTLDEIAMQLGVHEHDDAATWLLSYGRERFTIEREQSTDAPQ